VKNRLLPLVLVLAATLVACSSAGKPPVASAPSVAATAAAPSVAPADLTVYAAASLKKPLAKLKAAYEAANPGTTLAISTDSSTALATKIEQGALADVFLSADRKNPQALVDEGFAVAPVTTFATNLLTVIVPSSNPAGIASPSDLAKAGVKIIAAADTVPIAKYAAQLVDDLSKQAGYPADFAAGYTANVASKEDNVAAVVSKIELGEGDAGIVYATDAMGSDKVTAIPVPDAANLFATYGGVVVAASQHQAAAAAFLAWLTGPDAQAILASLGFLPAPS
jgi:molybdate transport system substrate-binding protein